MPMGSGRGLFLPVNAAVRKQIGKSAGDIVHITLYADDDEFDSSEFMECLADAPEAMKAGKQAIRATCARTSARPEWQGRSSQELQEALYDEHGLPA